MPRCGRAEAGRAEAGIGGLANLMYTRVHFVAAMSSATLKRRARSPAGDRPCRRDDLRKVVAAKIKTNGDGGCSEAPRAHRPPCARAFRHTIKPEAQLGGK